MAQMPGRTIFAPVSKQDPKHGRWILPLVVLFLVAFTYTFVNNLPPAETPTTTTEAAGGTTTTTPEEETTTTTSLPPEVVEFAATADALSGQAEEMMTQAQTLNDDYAETEDYTTIRDGLSELRVTTSDFNDSVIALTDTIPDAAKDKWTDVTTAAAAMKTAGDAMLDGLVNTSGSEARLAALDDYNVAAGTFSQAIEAAKEAAMQPATSDQ
jgi:hypothetical protein